MERSGAKRRGEDGGRNGAGRGGGGRKEERWFVGNDGMLKLDAVHKESTYPGLPDYLMQLRI